MKNRYRLIRRGERRSTFYAFDRITKSRISLCTGDLETAERLLAAKNEAARIPEMNLQIARVYLSASDVGASTRTWREVMDEMLKTRSGETQARFRRAVKESSFDCLRDLKLIETRAEHFLDVLEEGSVSTNVFLRRIHNFALDMNWLPCSVMPKRQWPAVHYQEKRAITFAEHMEIIDREQNREKRAFYQLCWFLGGSQGDIACLRAEDIDWVEKTIAYRRQKTDSSALIHFGKDGEAVLKILPSSGLLFPNVSQLRPSDRATEFKKRCASVGISGVTLHSYRYAWAERARTVGMSERFAQEALGHNSIAVHRAYAKKAKVSIPSLEDLERAVRKIIPLPRAVEAV